MTIAEARSIVQQFARNADDYSATEFDRAILATGNDFVNRTDCTRDLGTVSTVANQQALDTGWPSLFRSYRLRRIWYGSQRIIQITDAPTVLSMGEEGAVKGIPRYIGFLVSNDSSNQAVLNPTPDAVYALDFIWVPPFTVYTPGTATTSTVLNIPNDMIHDVMMYGAVARLQATMPEHQKFVRECRQLYDEHVMRCKGIVSLAGRVSPRFRLR